ncbi:MAG: anti-sigma factor [Acidobacteriia bacterium]|nr:anti-sigma factor [Terriglobia bacterium]
MSCKEVQPLLEGYLDGELDLVRSVEVEAHLQECSACSTEYQKLQELRSVLGSNSLYFKAPGTLHHRVQDTIRGKSPSGRRVWLSGGWSPLRWASVAASLVLVALITWNVAPHFSRQSADEILTQEIIDSHVRSLMLSHLTDVPSSDQHTVKPWFNGKVDFSPTVVDLADHGFRLIGGRIDYLGGKPVAALIYQRRQHFINLFIWPSPEDANATETALSQKGYHVVHWAKSKMTYWAVSDLNPKELGDFIAALKQQLP